MAMAGIVKNVEPTISHSERNVSSAPKVEKGEQGIGPNKNPEKAIGIAVVVERAILSSERNVSNVEPVLMELLANQVVAELVIGIAVLVITITSLSALSVIVVRRPGEMVKELKAVVSRSLDLVEIATSHLEDVGVVSAEAVAAVVVVVVAAVTESHSVVLATKVLEILIRQLARKSNLTKTTFAFKLHKFFM